MKYDVVVETAQAELVAAVRAKVPIGGIAQAWKPALDQVWAFLKKNGGLCPGHNLFLYHHAERRDEAMNIDFGVQVARPFEREGNVQCVETPLVRSQGRFVSVPTINWATLTMQSTLGALRTTGKSRGLRGKSTGTGITTQLFWKRRSNIC